jgi:hypothetical protein
VSTFYLLPPRAVLADSLGDWLHGFLPGVELDLTARRRLCSELVERLAGPDVFLVHREDLPANESAGQALIDGYGGGPGDEVVEIRPLGPRGSDRSGLFCSRRWRIETGGAASNAA